MARSGRSFPLHPRLPKLLASTGPTTWNADVSLTVTATVTDVALLAPGVAAATPTVTATVTDVALLSPAITTAVPSFTATTTAAAQGIHQGTFPTLLIRAQFTTGVWTDITSYVRSGNIVRASSRLQGPVVQYQAGTATLVLKNRDGRFDPDNASGPYWGSSATRTATFTTAGTWKCPTGVTSLTSAEVWAPGAGGGNDPAGAGNAGGGGGGGEYAKETSVAVTAGNTYTIPALTAGAGGSASSSQHDGADAPDISVAFDAVTVTAHGGKGGKAGAGGGGTGGAGGTGSTNATHHDGGAGATGATTYGGGGGSSAGPAAAGNAGSTFNGGTAVTGGGPGGNGGHTSPSQNGSTPASGPGGGGGGAFESSTPYASGAAGSAGQVTLTYTVSVAQTQVLPMVPIQVQATWSGTTYTLFTGYADAWTDPGDNYAGNYDEVTVTATDAFKILTNVTLAPLVAPVGAGEDSGTRVNRILDAARWSSTARAVTAGDTGVQATSLDDTAMNLLQLTADTELGELYVDGSGNLTFRHRLGLLTDTRSATAQGVFGDSPGTSHTAGTELKYEKVSRAEDDTTLVNDAQITIAGGSNLQEAADSDSIAKYLYPRTYQRTDLLLQDDTTALNYAQWIVYIGGAAENRFEVLSVIPARDGANLFPQVLGRELGDRVQVWRRPPNVAAVSKDCFIRGIQHDFTPLYWHTQWTLQSASKYGSFFVLDDPILGVLDTDALAY